MIQRKDITNTLPTGILENGEFTPDDAGLAVRMSGFYTVGELQDILEDLKHVDAVHKANKLKVQKAAGQAFEEWQRGYGTEAADKWALVYEADRFAVRDILSGLIQAYFKKNTI